MACQLRGVLMDQAKLGANNADKVDGTIRKPIQFIYVEDAKPRKDKPAEPGSKGKGRR
jgi:hypothetical protein